MTYIRSIEKFEYFVPSTLEDGLNILENNRERVKILNGGTDLILQMKQRLTRPEIILDIKQIPELRTLVWDESAGFRIGSAVPISKILEFKGLPEGYDLLFQVCSVIGSIQIKNRGTVGGNICNAAPSADSASALLCLDASALIASKGRTRTIPLNEFFIGPGETALKYNELLVEIIIPTPQPGSAGSYLRHTTREEMDIAVAGVASWLSLSKKDNKIEEARIALGAVGPTPLRAYKTEDFLVGKEGSSEIIEEAAELAASEAKPITDLRGSAEYRKELVRVLTKRTLTNVINILNG
jgi:CO/xanthine dehydrogenase FAD-binding subunit